MFPGSNVPTAAPTAASGSDSGGVAMAVIVGIICTLSLFGLMTYICIKQAMKRAAIAPEVGADGSGKYKVESKSSKRKIKVDV